MRKYWSIHVAYFNQLLSAEHTQKLVKLLKKQPKKDNFEVPPKGVDQLLHVDQLWEVDTYNFFFVHFQMFFVDFSLEMTKQGLK